MRNLIRVLQLLVVFVLVLGLISCAAAEPPATAAEPPATVYDALQSIYSDFGEFEVYRDMKEIHSKNPATNWYVDVKIEKNPAEKVPTVYIMLYVDDAVVDTLVLPSTSNHWLDRGEYYIFDYIDPHMDKCWIHVTSYGNWVTVEVLAW
jgi:hypothetical protein